MTYAAIVQAPFAMLGLSCREGALAGIDFLPLSTPARPPAAASLEQAAALQLQAWLADPGFRFDLPLSLQGTPFQLRVWEAIAAIPPGEVRSYQMLAQQLGTAPRAVGGACGRNPLPIIIPCHRVVARQGLGGFNLSCGDDMLSIKRWLLAHERQR